MNDVPFKDVYIHALIRDEHGKKMSKSLGNIIDPLEVMDKFGTDAFRFTLAALAAQGRDIRLSESRVEGYRNFMNKLWNAARFALPYLEGAPAKSLEGIELRLADRWILSRLNRTIPEVRQGIENYCFNDAAQALYHFTWHELCDWYLEEAKIPFANAGSKEAGNTAVILRHVLDAVMRMLHPFIPFITEEIASKLDPESGTIMRGPFPEVDSALIDDPAEKAMNLLMGVIGSVRNIRAEMNISPGKALPTVILPSSDDERDLVEANAAMVNRLGRISDLAFTNPSVEPPKMSATAVVGEMKVFVPLEGIIEPDSEIARLTKEIAKAQKELDGVDKKLSNPDFLGKANAAAIQKQQDRHAELTAKVSGLNQSLAKMRELKAK
jgi:valyl-tRNA synthetase